MGTRIEERMIAVWMTQAALASKVSITRGIFAAG